MLAWEINFWNNFKLREENSISSFIMCINNEAIFIWWEKFTLFENAFYIQY